MRKYKIIKCMYIDNVTGQEKNASNNILKQLLYSSNDIIALTHVGYECCSLSDVLIRLSKEIRVGASSITRYILFKEV